MRLASLILLTAIPTMTPAQQSEEKPYGKLPDGTPITEHVLKNKDGMTAKIITYGGILTSLTMPPDDSGKIVDVVLGCDSLDGYLKGHPYFGSNVGRCANRIANASFTLDGKEYKLAANNGKHSLHGGKVGFDKVVWKSEPVMTADGPGVKLSYVSKDGEEGYPGTLTVTVTYTLTNGNELKIDYHATTDKPTVCNLAHHSYFNLAGDSSGDVLGHELQVPAKNYTPGDDTLIPTGEIAPVAGTPFDFTTPTPIGKRIKEIKATPQGYDLNYVIDNPKTERMVTAAIVRDPKSGRTMTVRTTEPGVQFYTGNFLDGKTAGKRGAVYNRYAAFCLECQKFPDAIHKVGKEGWASPVLKPGETYQTTTVYAFGVGK
jgi:aldose 1-epimerase